MAGGKWIEDLHVDTPLADAARHVLSVRLEVVRYYLPKALHEPDKDPEHVHQLRVGTRRAGAALRIFQGCLPGKAYDRARKRLRRLRRAAGAARDWDVFLESLATRRRTKLGQRPGADFLAGYALGQRAVAQNQLAEASKDIPDGFESLAREIVASVRRPALGAKSLLDLARPLLGDLLNELDRAVGHDLTDYEHLHQVRIIGKRLRYAMEVFGSCFDIPFREVFYPDVEEMQEILGRANDSHVAASRLMMLRDQLMNTRPADWKRYRLAIEDFLGYHQRRLPQERRRFLRWWKDWQESGGEARLCSLLKLPKADAS